MIKVNWTVPTAGDGYWSPRAQQVDVTGINISYINKDQSFGELRVYFDTASWDTQVDGLIYTDSLFISELGLLLHEVGLDPRDLDYSEQGMQGNDYVSFDVGEQFMRSWLNRFALA